MFKYIIRRIVLIFVALFLVIGILFFSTWIATFEKYFKTLSFSDYFPFIWDKFAVYVTGIVKHWDWGTSESGDPVWPLVFGKIHYTLKITLACLLFFVTFGIGLGILSAIKKNTWIDKLIVLLTTIFSSLPSFVAVWLLMLTLGWGLKLVPAYYPVMTENPIEALLGLVIPVIALTMWPLSKITYLVRGEISEILSEEYMLLARTKGLSKTQCVTHHALGNVFVVIMPEIVNSFLFVLGSSFIVEIIYNVQGVANLFFDALLKPYMDHFYVNMDVPVAVLVATFYMSFGLVFCLVIDILTALIDPRIKIGSKK
jgi:oligopeptide transport system permease protein